MVTASSGAQTGTPEQALKVKTAQTANADWPMPDSAQTAYDNFIKIAKQKNISRLNEWQQGYGALDEALKRTKK